MKQKFYEIFYINLNISIRYGKMDARAEMDAGKMQFYKELEKFVKQLVKETKEYIAEKDSKQ